MLFLRRCVYSLKIYTGPVWDPILAISVFTFSHSLPLRSEVPEKLPALFNGHLYYAAAPSFLPSQDAEKNPKLFWAMAIQGVILYCVIPLLNGEVDLKLEIFSQMKVEELMNWKLDHYQP